jgi:hypothetical protein
VGVISLDLPYSSDMAVNQLISTNLAAMNGGKTDSVKESKLLEKMENILAENCD